jgi:molybdopterin/thiamine biosynthesis adenylyltransferase
MFYYEPHTIPNTIIVIGCGGTGSRLVPQLAQFIKTCSWVINPSIILVDDDVVEEKNLLRQNFIRSDVGKPKARVLAERYGQAYGVNISSVVARISQKRGDIGNYTSIIQPTEDGVEIGDINSAMVIMCVDSAEARRSILQAFGMANRAARNALFWIDAGNEDSYGQVSFFHPKVLAGDILGAADIYQELPALIPVSVPIPFIPFDFDQYLSMKDALYSQSCADLDQTLAINSLMASTIMGVVQNYYYRKRMNFNRINLSLTDGCSTNMLTPYNLNRMLASSGARSRISPWGIGEADSFTIFERLQEAISTYNLAQELAVSGTNEVVEEAGTVA